MITYITWNKSDDAAFRTYYFSLTNEKIQDNPTDLDDKFEIGSSRLYAEKIAELSQFAMVSIATEPSTYKGLLQQQSDNESSLSINNSVV